MLIRGLAVQSCLALSLAAQTFVVDALDRPGTDFASLATAVASVPDGAVLSVRGGTYFEALPPIRQGLSIICEPGAVVSTPGSTTLTITGLTPRQSVVVRDLELSPTGRMPLFAHITCSGCEGLVLLDSVVPSALSDLELSVADCAQFVARSCVFRAGFSRPGARFYQSNAVLESCDSRGWLGPAVTQIRGTLQLSDSSIYSANWAAIESADGELRLLGTTRLSGTALAAASASAIKGTSNVRIGLRVAFVGGLPRFDPTLNVALLAMPQLTSTSNGATQRLLASLHSPLGDAGAILVGIPAAPRSVPGLVDALWIAPRT